MALLEKVLIDPRIAASSHTSIEYSREAYAWREPFTVPHIFLDDGEPWLAANRYAIDHSVETDPQTIVSKMGHLKAYASWLESVDLQWTYFPKKKADRCLFRYRGFLVQQRNAGTLSPSTVTARMAAVVRFYRWAAASTWIANETMWRDNTKVLSFSTSEGFVRTIQVLSSELSIPNRSRNYGGLEDGLMPLSRESEKTLINFLQDQNQTELRLMFAIGLMTGARSETIRTLRLSNLDAAIEDPSVPGLMRVQVGPGTNVKTKFNVSGSILFPASLVERLRAYASSTNRLARQSIAPQDKKTLLFITKFGNGYSSNTFTKLVSDLRRKLADAGLHQFENLKFHQTRASYGTNLTSVALDSFKGKSNAIAFVRDAMLHKDEATTWKYVRFIESEPLKEALSDEFSRLFMGDGSSSPIQDIIDKAALDERR